jgi:hypothetical protein
MALRLATDGASDSAKCLNLAKQNQDRRRRGQNPLTQESRFNLRLRIPGGTLEPRRSDGGRVAYFEGVVAG